MSEPTLEARLRNLAADEMPEAPWLEDRVMLAVGTAALRPNMRGPRFALVTAGAGIIAALVVGALVGTRLIAPLSSASRVTPSHNVDIVRYRSVVDGDLRAVDRADAGSCNSRGQCVLTLEQTRSAAYQLLTDLSADPAPDSVSAPAEAIKVAASRLILQLDAAISIASRSNTDYLAASAAPDVGQLDLTVAELDCWPALPVLGGHGTTCS